MFVFTIVAVIDVDELLISGCAESYGELSGRQIKKDNRPVAQFDFSEFDF